MRSILAVVVAVLAAGCATPHYLAKVNGQEVTQADLMAEFEARHAGHKRFLAGETEIKRFVDIIVDKTLMVQEGNQIGLQELPEVREAVAEYDRKQQVKQLQKVEVDDKARPTEAEIQAVYDGQTDTLVEALQIVVETEEEAKAVRAELEAGADFETLARSRSIADSSKYAGRLPRMGWGAMDPAWEAAVAAAPDGQLTQVFRTSDGWEVVKVIARHKVDKPDLAKARKRIEGILTSRKRKAAEKAFHAELWAKYDVQLKPFDRSPPALRKAIEEKSSAPVATWTGGNLALLAFADTLDLEKLRELSATGYQDKVESLLDQAVDAKLMPIEAAARRYGDLPDIKEKVRRYQDNLVEGALYADYVLPDVKVTDAEVEAYYEAHKQELLTPEKRRVSHIVVESLPRAAEVEEKIKAGVPFPELVDAYSTDATTRKNGGSLGEIAKGQVNKEFDPVFALQVGECTAPIQTQFGYHIFKVTGILPPRVKELSVARDDIYKRLLQQKQSEARKAWVAKLRASADIVVSDAAIHKFALEQGAELEKAAGDAAPSHMMQGMPGMPAGQ